MAAPASYSRRSFVGNAAATTVPLGLGASDGSCTIASAANWPSGSGGDFLVVIDRGQNTEELAWSSGVSGTTLTFAARGAQGTSGVAHGAGCTIALSMGQQDLDEANQVVNQVLGQASAAKGDLLTMLSAAGPNTLERIAIGSSTQVLGVSGGIPAWETPTNGYGITGFAANPMTPAVSLSYVKSYISSDVNLSVGGTDYNLTSLTLAAGTWLLQAVVSVYDTAGAIAAVDGYISTTSASLTGLVGIGSSILGDFAGGTEWASIPVFAIVAPSGSTTYYLNAQSSTTTMVVKHLSAQSTSAGATGMAAIRIA